MDQKILTAVQGAFKQAVEAFNAALIKNLPASVLSGTEEITVKRRGRPAKAKPAAGALKDAAPKRRGRPAKAPATTPADTAPRRRGRPRKNG